MNAGHRGANTAQLLQLSHDANRLAGTLAQLSTQSDYLAFKSHRGGPMPDINEGTIRSLIKARRLRARYFRDDLFADPAWDILLELFRAELAQHRVSVTSLSIAAAVPATTALRWINSMVQDGLLNRHADPVDGRRVFVELSPDTHEAMCRYFAEVVGAT